MGMSLWNTTSAGIFKGIQLRCKHQHLNYPVRDTALRVPFRNRLTWQLKLYNITPIFDVSEHSSLFSKGNAYGGIFLTPLCFPHVSLARLRTSAAFQDQTIWIQSLPAHFSTIYKTSTKIFKRQECALEMLTAFLASSQSTWDYFEFRRSSWQSAGK